MSVTEKDYQDRKAAGRTLMTEILTLVQPQHEAELVLAQIGGVDLIFEGERYGRGDGYRYAIMLRRTGADYEIDLPVTVTPLGAISRLEHALDSFGEEREQYRHRHDDALRRLASYRSREGGTFAFADEVLEKRAHLADLEKLLAANDGAPAMIDEPTYAAAVSA